MDTSDYEKKENQGNLNPEIYLNSREHVLEELRLIDLLLYRKFLDLKTSQNDVAGQFKGLVITDNEVLKLLTSNLGNTDSDDKDISINEDIKKDIDKKIESYRTGIDNKLQNSLKKGTYLSLSYLSSLFNLNEFEKFCLLICLGIEVDGKYEKIYSYLQDDVTKKKPSVQFVINLFTEDINQRIDARTFFREESPLLRFQLIEIINASETREPFISKFIKLDDKIADFLLGINNINSKLQKLSCYFIPSEIEDRCELSPELKNKVDNFSGVELKKLEEAQKKILFSFSGPVGSGKLRLTKYICKKLNIPLLEIDCGKILQKGHDAWDHLFIASRESLLLNSALCLNNFEALLSDPNSGNLIKTICNEALIFSPITFINSSVEFAIDDIPSEKVLIEHKFDIPNVIERKEIWSKNLENYQQIFFEKELVDDLAAKFRFTEGQISQILGIVSRKTDLKNLNINTFKQQELYDACRTNSNNEIKNLASKIKANQNWDEMVLPENQMDQLRDICNYSKYHFKVYGEWGFDKKLSYGKGLNVLFTGPPGTGKTMAAEVLAKELDIDLYKIDLSQVVSKYIGETEKNLHKIFNEAQKTYSILFFDEADSLFGKRSEVKDAHDRYANIEIGYLLQKMEEYDGITILATNLKNNIDDAFIRRIQFIVEFPFPDEVYRKKIWEVIFPHQTPLSEELNYEILAREIKLTGGNIKNIALSAAFFAASEKKDIQMPHIIKAARREHQKIGRTWSSSLTEDSETGLTH